jgi:serine/threonine protein kinase
MDSAPTTTCDSSSVVPAVIALSVIGVLFFILSLTSFLYLKKRGELIALYADPRNKIVTFLRPEDFHSDASARADRKSSRRNSRRPSHRDVLAEAKRIEEGKGSEDSIPRRKSVDAENSGHGGSVIFAKTVGDPTNPANFVEYEWEIPFSEIKLHKRIGGGQFGDVYTGEWLDTDVAVKCPRSDIRDEELAVFMREVKIMSKIHHPNIVLFLGACLIKPNICLVMEYITGGNLFDYLNSPGPPPGPPPDSGIIIEESENYANSTNSGTGKNSSGSKSPETKVKAITGPSPDVVAKREDYEIDFMESIRFAIDVARGMKYLHDRAKVVQRDLKSKNLLIDSTMAIKICDFGLSRLETKNNASGSTMNELGTPYWLAPEVIKKEKSGTKADVYSFAVVLWEIFTHEIPHKEMTALEVAYAVAHKGLRPTIKKGTPPTVASLMRRCWKSNPDHRPDFSEILDLLMNECTRMESGSISPMVNNEEGGSRSSLYSGRDSRGGILPLQSPLAQYMRGKGAFFSVPGTPVGGSMRGIQGLDAEELRKLQQARQTGRRQRCGGRKRRRKREKKRDARVLFEQS